MQIQWTNTPKYLYGELDFSPELHQPIRIAGFDLDDTLIYRQQHRNKNDWTFLYPNIHQKIAPLVRDKYIIVVFSNQSGMSSNKKFDMDKFKEQVEIMQKKMFHNITEKYFFSIVVSKCYDIYRKPNPGMWSLIKKILKNKYVLEKVSVSTRSFYCGDAAGRLNLGYYRKTLDFSDTDRKFALNLKIKFYTPEMFYLGKDKNAPFSLSGFDPHKYILGLKKDPVNSYQFTPRSKELIILVGPPGSGKSEFFNKYLANNGYTYISRDIYKTIPACLQVMTLAIKLKKSMALDGLNHTIETRNIYISHVKKYGYRNIRSIILKTNIDMANHLNNVRHLYSQGRIPKISAVVYRSYLKYYNAPTKKEEFDIIEEIRFDFDVGKLNDRFWKKCFMLWSESI